MQKSITLFTSNYFPEDSAIGLYTSQLVDFLSSKGFQIKVITGFPNYPFWKIFSDYEKHPAFYKEYVGQVEVFRYKQYIPKNVTFKGRVLMMLSLTYGAFVNSFKIKTSNFTICVVPFTLVLLPAVLFSWRKSSKLLVHVQDFEFDLAFESGIAKNSFLLKLIKKPILLFEKFLLKKAYFISTISNNMMEVGRKKSGKDIAYFPNWISESNINSNFFNQHQYVSSDKFTMLYSGNIGEKQDWNCLIEIAKKIKPDDNIEIVIVGSGAFLATLKQQIVPFSFIKIYDPVAYLSLNDLLCSANLHFLFQKTDVVDTVMPSKLLGMMASAKPSIVTGNNQSEVKTIFEKSNCGIYSSNNDADFLYNKLIKLKQNVVQQREMGESAKKYVLQYFSQEKVLNSYYDEILKMSI